MAVVSVSGTERVMRDADEISSFLGRYGIWYRRAEGGEGLNDDSTEEDVLGAYDDTIGELKRRGGYRTADVIDVQPDTPGLPEMLARFQTEHWHDEDEVRFVVAGSGVFHVRPRDGDVFKIEVGAGDMINIPAGTWHWFHLCSDSRIRCIRLFLDPSGWKPHYTESGVDRQHDPVCFGPNYLPPGRG